MNISISLRASISITGDGTLAVKLSLAELSRAIKNKKVTEREIDRAEANSDVKNYLKGIWSKLVEKSQEEMVNMLFSPIRSQGVPLITLLIALLR